ncbi:MAG: magnesium transporter [Candidatus Aminicenantes bacterium]|nr:magnesium transporter [Candidatus Aminicenantes bacterium]NIM78359.1 magnesium transporter [Candidatus Aminicenantes bacterium]NIN17593.1 magnesium transporter [Candidatus Aminicenantes bacterium]NIN41471.1 magnesium transporter [Candidatus Aminicenantes bacterium]NIN84245.1 magnesium transporter [Candidatus Aminicenantes bacterium]
MKQAALEKLLRITKQFIKLRTLGHLWNALAKIHYADIATLIEHLTPQEQTIILQLMIDRKLDMSKFAEIISEIKPEIAVELLSRLKTDQIVPILEALSSDDAASLISLFDEELRLELLNKMKKEDSAGIQEQLAYPEESAGRIMSTDFLALHESTTVGDAITAIQLASEEVEVPFYLYVIDDEERLKGVVSLKQLILVNAKLPLKEIMNPDVYKVDAFLDQEEVASVVANYNLLAIPVVDEHYKLVGVVTVDDVIDIIQEEATEDIYKLAGVQDYSVDLTTGKSLLKRMPWLFMSLLTTSLSAVVVAIFKGTIEQFIQLAVLMHIVPALGGVVGNQSVAIMVREIVLGTLEWKRAKKVLFKELAVSIGSGLAIGAVASAASYLIFDKWKIGAVFGAAIFFNLFMAALLGTLIPLVLKRLKLDPALASGMIVTMLTDGIGLFGFLGLATLLLLK